MTSLSTILVTAGATRSAAAVYSPQSLDPLHQEQVSTETVSEEDLKVLNGLCDIQTMLSNESEVINLPGTNAPFS